MNEHYLYFKYKSVPTNTCVTCLSKPTNQRRCVMDRREDKPMEQTGRRTDRQTDGRRGSDPNVSGCFCGRHSKLPNKNKCPVCNFYVNFKGTPIQQQVHCQWVSIVLCNKGSAQKKITFYNKSSSTGSGISVSHTSHGRIMFGGRSESFDTRAIIMLSFNGIKLCLIHQSILLDCNAYFQTRKIKILMLHNSFPLICPRNWKIHFQALFWMDIGAQPIWEFKEKS